MTRTINRRRETFLHWALIFGLLAAIELGIPALAALVSGALS